METGVSEAEAGTIGLAGGNVSASTGVQGFVSFFTCAMLRIFRTPSWFSSSMELHSF